MPRVTAWRRLLVSASALLLGSCSGPNAPPPPGPGPQIDVQIADEHAVRQAVEQQRGKVVLVDFWATWCIPCKELFPHTVQLHRRLADRGLAVIAVSLDDPDDLSAVRQFLARQEAEFPNFISRYGAGTDSVKAFDIGGNGLPHFKLYDRQGRLYRTFSGDEAADPRQLDRAVEELLAKGP